VVAACAALASAACSHNEPAAATAASGGGGGAAASGGPSIPDCPAEFVIDDFQDGNNQILVHEGRKGYWYTFVDKVGTTVSPPAGKKFIMSPGGANGAPYSARYMGKITPTGDPQYAGMGFSFTNPKNMYDASKFTGIAFWAKAGPGQHGVRVKVPDVNTDPDGKVCTECFNDFGADLDLTDQWKHYVIKFDDMSQMEGWGSPLKDKIDKSKVTGIQWQVNKPGQNYDIWISDVSFTGCP
jgi:endoglucanase